MEAPRCAEGHGLVPQVLQLLLGLVQHLHALCILVLQLPQLHEKEKVEQMLQPEHLIIQILGLKWGLILFLISLDLLTVNFVIYIIL